MTKKPKTMTPEQIAEIKRLYTEEGVNYYQIAKRLKIPTHVAKYHTERVLLQKVKSVDELAVPSHSAKVAMRERLDEQEALSLRQKNKILLDIIVEHLGC